MVVYENTTVVLCRLAVLLRPVLKMARVGVGLKLFIVAFLSYFDFVTDILVSQNLYESGEEKWAAATLTCVGAAIGFQTSFVTIRYHKCGWKKLGTKVLLTVTCVMPLVQAAEVWTGADMEEGCVFPPLMMLVSLKGCEAFGESLPEGVMQVVGFLSFS